MRTVTEVESPTGTRRCRFQPCCRDPEPPFDVEFVKRVSGPKLNPVRFPLTRQQLLRQRRPVVRTVRLGSDDHHLSVGRALAQRLRGAQTCEGGSDDGEAIR